MTRNTSASQRPRVVIVGASLAGLAAAKQPQPGSVSLSVNARVRIQDRQTPILTGDK
jgi:hypothetical protein